ncbi:hypothetical protein D3C73_1188550 [compost metagenome]
MLGSLSTIIEPALTSRRLGLSSLNLPITAGSRRVNREASSCSRVVLLGTMKKPGSWVAALPKETGLGVLDADAKPAERGAAGLPAKGVVGWGAAPVVWGAALLRDS